MLLSTSPKELLLACSLSPPWNLPSFTVEFTLSFPCSRSDLPFSRQGAALAHLNSLPLTIWYSKLTALFFFFLAKAAPAYLPTALSVALKPLFPFQQAQYAQVFLLRPALFCKLFAGLGSTNKSVTSVLFSSYLTLVLSSSPCSLLRFSFYLKRSGRSGRNSLSSCSISFLPENDVVDELASGER